MSDDARTPPQDLAAEQSVLGSMMLSGDAIADCLEIVKGHHFYRPAHETIFDAIVDVFGKGERVDAVVLADELTKRGDINRVGGVAYLHQLIQSVPTAANAGYYAEIVHERAVLRSLVEAGTRIVQMGHGQGEGEVDDIVNRAQAEVFAVGEKREGHDYVHAVDLIQPFLDRLEAAAKTKGEITGIRTGFANLDQMLHGLKPGQLVIIGARPSVGKSTLALDIAREAAFRQLAATAVFTLEMSRDETMDKLVSAECAIPLQDIRKGALSKEQWTTFGKKMAAISEAPLVVDDSPNLTLTEIRAKIRRLKQQENLRLVIIDYLQLMTSGKRVESRQQEVAEFSRALKLLAKEAQVPIIALSQLNRGPEQRADKRPQMSDLRESGSVEQDADIVILLHRDREDPEREGEADLILAKHRNGPTGDVTVAFQGHLSRFHDMADTPGDW